MKTGLELSHKRGEYEDRFKMRKWSINLTGLVECLGYHPIAEILICFQ